MAKEAEAISSAVQTAWNPFRDAMERLGDEQLELATRGGWSGKEMLAHVAFWDEAVLGVVIGMFRGQPLPDGWRFGSGYLPKDGEAWVPADVHNARESAWAATRTRRDVVDRVDDAHDQLEALLATVTDEEAREHATYFGGLGSHYREHLPDLEDILGPDH